MDALALEPSMQTIDAINEIIGYVGETAIDATDSDYASHPLYESALRILTSTSRAVQSKGWWFNTRLVTLSPSSGTIAVDQDVYLSVDPVNTYGVQYAVRAGHLYDMTNGTATLTAAVQAVVREYLAFADLPETAAKFVALKAGLRFVKEYDGDRSKLSEVKEDAAEAYALFHMDHIRNSNVNLYQLPNTLYTLSNSWYGRYRQR